MTSFNDPGSEARCCLVAELKKGWTPPRFTTASFAIKDVAAEFEQRFGGAAKELPPPTNLLEEAEWLLVSGHGDLSRLERKHLKSIPHFLWHSSRGWSEMPALVDSYLEWANQNWRTAPRRLWRHYLLNLNPKSLATRRLARWLQDRRDQLSPILRDFSERWALLDPEAAIQRLAQSLLAGDAFLSEIEHLKVARDDVIRSAFMLSVLESLGRRLREHRQPSGIVAVLKSLLSPLGETPTYQMEGPDNLRQAALKSLVEGLVTWSERQGEPAINQTLGWLDTLIGDPRLRYSARWVGIDPDIRALVERWLTKITLGTFFEVMREFTTDRPDMVDARERFWRRYEKHIGRAWLITTSAGKPIARRLLNESFGEFSGGHVDPYHLGLMLQIGNYVIFEMNKNGSTLFWPVSDPQMPGFFAETYFRSNLINSCRAGPEQGTSRFRMTHHDGWETKYEWQIRARTGISPAK
jgi:hypothetical protein